MGSNGKQRFDQILIVIIYNLQLQWTPMASSSLDRLLSSESSIYNSNGFQWAPMVSNTLIRLLSSSSKISNSNGLQWATMVSISQKNTENIELILNLQLQWTPIFISNGLQWKAIHSTDYYLHHIQSTTTMNSNGLKWTPMDSNGSSLVRLLSSSSSISNSNGLQ